MDVDEHQQQPTVTLRLRRHLHHAHTDGPGHRFSLGDRPQQRADTSIRVGCAPDGTAGVVEIERRAHSYFPVFFHVGAGGQLVLADTMGFMHDIARRGGVEPSAGAQLQHLLFGRPPSTGLLSGVDVVDHGERVRLERTRKGWNVESRRHVDRLFHDAATSWREGLGEFAGRLHEATSGVEPDSMLFSGGIDSTLLTALVDGEPTMITARIPGEQFAPELERASCAAELIGGQHRVVDIDHGDYPDLLADITRTTGLPCPAMQHVLQTRAAADAARAAGYGELGDGTYGFPLVAREGLRDRVEASGRHPADVASRVFSLASTRDEDADFAADLENVYGSLNRVYDERAARVRRLVDVSPQLQGADRRWEQFLVYGHAVDFLTVGCIRFVRDFASSQGVCLHTPLMDRRVIDSFHRFDPAGRYRDRGRTKPVLKAVLSREMPGYEVDQPKLASGLPRSWYFTEGPLADVFDRFEPPSPIVEAVGRAVDNPGWHNSWLLWPALSYSVWYREWFDAASLPERSDLVVYSP